MKKYILVLFAAMLTLASHAQSKITKDKIVGKWSVSAIELKGLIYYSVDKDSIVLSDSVKAGIAKSGMDAKAAEGMMKQSFAVFTAMRFTFDADGKAKFDMGLQPSVESEYTVDEEKSTINSTDSNGEAEVMKAEMVGELLRLLIPNPQGEMWVLLKKSKT